MAELFKVEPSVLSAQGTVLGGVAQDGADWVSTRTLMSSAGEGVTGSDVAAQADRLGLAMLGAARSAASALTAMSEVSASAGSNYRVTDSDVSGALRQISGGLPPGAALSGPPSPGGLQGLLAAGRAGR